MPKLHSNFEHIRKLCFFNESAIKVAGYVGLMIFISACVFSNSAYIAIGNATVVAEIADSPEERQKGLMHRDYLASDAGMLFVFPDEEKRSFWMKNTKIPLNIVFISSNFTIVDIQIMEPCKEEPCRIYLSKEPAKYALEVNKGFAEKNGLHDGDKIKIDLSL